MPEPQQGVRVCCGPQVALEETADKHLQDERIGTQETEFQHIPEATGIAGKRRLQSTAVQHTANAAVLDRKQGLNPD